MYVEVRVRCTCSLLLLFCLPVLSILCLKTPKIQGNELARPVIGYNFSSYYRNYGNTLCVGLAGMVQNGP